MKIARSWSALGLASVLGLLAPSNANACGWILEMSESEVVPQVRAIEEDLAAGRVHQALAIERLRTRTRSRNAVIRSGQEAAFAAWREAASEEERNVPRSIAWASAEVDALQEQIGLLHTLSLARAWHYDPSMPHRNFPRAQQNGMRARLVQRNRANPTPLLRQAIAEVSECDRRKHGEALTLLRELHAEHVMPNMYGYAALHRLAAEAHDEALAQTALAECRRAEPAGSTICTQAAEQASR